MQIMEIGIAEECNEFLLKKFKITFTFFTFL